MHLACHPEHEINFLLMQQIIGLNRCFLPQMALGERYLQCSFGIESAPKYIIQS